jgi:hypothetical protein
MGLLSSFTTAIAGILGPKFIGPLMQGFSLSYVVVLPVRLLSLLTLPDKDFEATILYFGINIAILTAMAISVPVLNNKFLHFMLNRYFSDRSSLKIIFQKKLGVSKKKL